MKKVVVKSKRITRELKANPFSHVSVKTRVEKSQIKKYGEMPIIEDFLNGYSRMAKS